MKNINSMTFSLIMKSGHLNGKRCVWHSRMEGASWSKAPDLHVRMAFQLSNLSESQAFEKPFSLLPVWKSRLAGPVYPNTLTYSTHAGQIFRNVFAAWVGQLYCDKSSNLVNVIIWHKVPLMMNDIIQSFSVHFSTNWQKAIWKIADLPHSNQCSSFRRNWIKSE